MALHQGAGHDNEEPCGADEAETVEDSDEEEDTDASVSICTSYNVYFIMKTEELCTVSDKCIRSCTYLLA